MVGRFIAPSLVLLAALTSTVANAAPGKRAPASTTTTTTQTQESGVFIAASGESIAAPNAATATDQESTATISSDDPWRGWPGRYSSYIGFESGTNSIGVIGRDLIVYGRWNGDTAIEYFVGFEKTADNFAKSSTSTTSGTTTTSQSNVNASSGAKNPYVLTGGAGWKKKIYQGRWIQVYGGFFGGLTYTTAANYQTGSTTTTTPDVAVPGTFTVTETNVGDVTANTDLIFFGGAKLGSEFYLRWFPNLALGFATGTFLSYGGKRTTTTSTSSQSYTVTNGTPATPTSKSGQKSDSVTDPGISSDTFGIGGTSFQFTGLFTIRYVWR